MLLENEITVETHPLVDDLDLLLEEVYSKERIYESLEEELVSSSEPIKFDHVRFVCISDTHEQLDKLLPSIPFGDVLVHCGDFTNFGDEAAIKKFDAEIGSLPHKYKIVIAGNHELGFEDGEDLSQRIKINIGRGTSQGYKLLKNCIYLYDESVTVHGIKVYGSSWHAHRGFGFFCERGQPLLDVWNKIPSDTDVLLTHFPALGHRDSGRHRRGCVELLNTIEKRVKPKFHIFGHCHNQHGISTNGETIFINAASVNIQHKIVHEPIVFDLPLPKGIAKN